MTVAEGLAFGRGLPHDQSHGDLGHGLGRMPTFASEAAVGLDSARYPPTAGSQEFVASMFSRYEVGPFHDEMLTADGQPRPVCAELYHRIQGLPAAEIQRRQLAAHHAMVQMGVTFNVYGDDQGRERIIPFDILPRIVEEREWQRIEAGLIQRIRALNCFLQDIYDQQRIVQEGLIPEHVIRTATCYRPECQGIHPPRGIWCHITGTDLVRDRDGQIFVLEDNLRCPSGVSYVLQNRQLVKQTFPQVFERTTIRPVDDYPGRLLAALQYLMEQFISRPAVALLSPGSYNSAYFEHSFLASQMGIDLVEGRDLVVIDGLLYKRTTKGFEQIDVLYRRIDDDFLDPRVFQPHSLLGVPGLMDCYRAGRVALANAPGTGVADDKVVYAYVPQMIRFYLTQDPILPNVPTFLCFDDAQRQHVLTHLDELVVKPANEAGGYGLFIGPQASPAERQEIAARVQQNPRGYIAQPIISLSRAPVLTENGIEGRHVDLRPFIIQGQDIYVLPGGLTRVALQKGSLIVNSSQGGGSKDTWVVT